MKIKKGKSSRMGIHDDVRNCPLCGGKMTFDKDAPVGKVMFECLSCGWTLRNGESMRERLAKIRK